MQFEGDHFAKKESKKKKENLTFWLLNFFSLF